MASVPSLKTTALACCAALAVGFGIPPGARAERADSVAVAAGADPVYLQDRLSGSSANAKAESYVFVQGSRFGGYLRDLSLERTQFAEIVRVLAPDLATQRFYQAVDKKNADLLIVVHWGITSVEEDPTHGQLEMEKLNRDLASYNSAFRNGSGGQTGAIADPGMVNADLAIVASKSGAAGSGPAGNARLLGYASELQKEEYRSLGVASGMTELDRRLREDLLDERYFVILMAYDYASVKGGKQGSKPKLLWSTHFSMRAVGHNFTTALPAMSKVAALYFGRNVDGLLLDARKVPEGRVEVGEPKVVDEGKAR